MLNFEQDCVEVTDDMRNEDGEIVTPCYELSDNQESFIQGCPQEFEVYYSYSGRGMYGKMCPAVNLESATDLIKWETSPDVAIDQLGYGIVVYAPR